ncbi:MAG: helicase-related protein [Candidatus Hodarchaeota archaeon]
MNSGANSSDWKPNLGMLKDFQRKTVNYVFRRLYTSPNRVDRFLIADEVGLGKTLVARGVIAKAIEFLKDTVDRIDVVYICSNSSIARQNVNRLNVTGSSEASIAKRMTLLPLYTNRLVGNKVNFVSFTPGTSFDLRSRGGIAEERALIYHILRKGWRLGDEAPPKNLLMGDMSKESWKRHLKNLPLDEIDKALSGQFIKALKEMNMRRRFNRLAKQFPRVKKYKNIPYELRQERSSLIGELRTVLAKSCVSALEPDIVILDEFQRFKNLLAGDDEVARLANAVFEYPKVKVILLSATPYKMYTMYHEKETDDHYEDFLNTVGFLFNSSEKTDTFEKDLEKYRDAILDLSAIENPELMKAKQRIESRLRKTMVRTERLSANGDPKDMVSEMEVSSGTLKTSDLKSFAVLDKIAGHLGVGDTVEYWKSAPYLLNAMNRDGYKIKKELVSQMAQLSDQELLPLFKDNHHHMLKWERIRSFKPVDPGNSRVRTLLNNTVDQGAWKLLWISPSLPYYSVKKGPYAEPHIHHFTKSLIFSSWLVVPKVISLLTSYEAERRMVTSFDQNAEYDKERHRPRLLDFKSSRERLTGMTVFTLTFPCLTLALKFDPLEEAKQALVENKVPDVQYITEKAEAFVEGLLSPILDRFRHKEGQPDERWYWAALAALDWKHYRKPTRAWFDTEGSKYKWSFMAGAGEDAESRFVEHIQLFKEHFRTPRGLGRPPRDLIPVLAKITLASPAVSVLRALLRFCKPYNIGRSGDWLLSSAARVAMGFRSLFNLPEAMTLIRGQRPSDDARYWETVLDYCVDGNLQSVLDEYTHILRESLGLMDLRPREAIPQIGDEMHSAVSLRTVSLDFDEIRPDAQGGKLKFHRHSIRCRFGLRFGDAKSEEEKTEIRKDQVRAAFNSPFRPFVLATTSVGQEGLDFHQYCHDIYHWNLPSNPVDLEQREGRIHRYKGHMIRRNVAKAFPLRELKEFDLNIKDPWEVLFKLAHDNREEGLNDLVPFWTYPVEDGYKIRRHVPIFPLSRDREHLEYLMKTLVAYRMVLGQPRQEDLVNYLGNRFEEGLNSDEFLKYRIDLSPR